MAMAGEPQLAQTNPQAYYMWLVRSQRMPPQQAYQLVSQRFGAPKTPEQQQKEAADDAQSSGLAQVGGAVGGAVLTGQAMQGFPALTGVLGGGGTAATGAGAAGAGTAGAGAVTANPATLGGITSLGGSGAGAGGAAGASTLGSIGSVALPVAAILAAASNAWETGGKDIVKGRGNRADWTNQGFNALTGALPNIALRMLGKPSLGEMSTTGKSMPQKQRDDFRGLLKETGVADENYHVKLADGSTFNIGLDGKTKYKNVGKNVDGKTERNAWDVDYSNPLSNYAVGKIDPMIRQIYGTDGKVKAEQYTGMLVNAVTSNAKTEEDVMANIKAMIGGSKFGEQFGGSLQPTQQRIARPGKGQVVRVSPGVYMNDQGRVRRASSMRQSLEQNYGKSKGKK
jgi:hypothetical protein